MVIRMSQISLSFWMLALGFLSCTWDTIFTLETAGFTLKIHQLFFLLAAGAALFEQRRSGLLAFLRPLSSPFAIFMLFFAGFNMGLSPWSTYPLKSFLYSCWLIFDLLAIWLTFQHVGRTHEHLRFFQVAWVTMILIGTVILIDQVAYHFGYIGGLIGHNQDIRLKWGLSRPHAFSSEPSYVASFLSLGLITTAVQMFYSAKKKWVFWSALMLIIFANVATTSRTGWFSLALGFGMLGILPLLVGRKFQTRPLVAFFGLVGLVILVFYATTPTKELKVMNKSLLSSMARGEDGSGNARLQAHIQAFELARDTRWIGVGFAASYKYFLDHGGSDYSAPGDFSQEHFGNELIMSTWGQLLAEGGIPSVILFGLAVFYLTRALFRKWKVESNGFTLGSCGAALVFFGFTAFCLGNVCRGDVWVWYGLWSAVAFQGNSKYSLPS